MCNMYNKEGKQGCGRYPEFAQHTTCSARQIIELVCMFEGLPDTIFFFFFLVEMEACSHYSNWLEFKLRATSERHCGPVGSMLNHPVHQQVRI